MMDPGQLYSRSQRAMPPPSSSSTAHPPDSASAPPASNQAQRQAQTKHISSNIFKQKKDSSRSQSDSITITSTSSPRLPKLLTRGSEARRGSGAELDENPASPISIPLSPLSGSHQRRLGGGNSFNNHYRSISKSMNDLGSIFSRGRSPPNREMSPGRPRGLNPLPEGKKAKHKDDGGGAMHGDGGDRIIKEGWLNMVDSHSIKKGPLRDAWRLQQAIVYGHHLLLYKPSSNLQVKAFDVTIPSTNAARPQTAPSLGMAALSLSSLKHRATSQHPDLAFTDDGKLQGGTIEALCHEMLFGKEDLFTRDATVTLPAWTAPETALSIMSEYVNLDNLARRIILILETILDHCAGLLLEPAVLNSAKLLVEKGVTPHDPKAAKKLREQIESYTATLTKKIPRPPHLEEQVVYPHAPRLDGGFASNLTAAEFLQITPEEFAGQLHFFHREFLLNWHPVHDLSVLLRAPHAPPTNYRYPLIFSNTSPHFITERVFAHILTGDAAVSIRYRAAVISHWLKVAQVSNIRGDFVAWLAIVTALLSPSILRLQETWSCIDAGLIETLAGPGQLALRKIQRRKLSLLVDADESLHIFGPDDIGFDAPPEDVIPYFGDLAHALDEVYASGGRTINIMAAIDGVKNMMWTLRHSEKYQPRAAGKSKVSKTMPQPEPDYQKLFRSLNYNHQNTPAVNSAAFFEMSLQCEPSSTGMYLQSHYHEKLPLDFGANLPLIFTEYLSRFSLFDKEDALALSGSNYHKKSGSSPLSPIPGTISQQPSPLSQNHQASTARTPLRRTRSFPPSKPPARTTGYDELDFTTRERTALLHSVDPSILGPIRDVAGVGQHIFYSKDEELVLKAIADDESRPSSVVESTNKRTSIASRRLSAQYATNSPRHSAYGEPNSPKAAEFHIDPRPLQVVAKGGTLERLVDILVLGVEDFSRRMKKSNEQDEPPLLSMDMNVFTITFFATFRSYCSPVVLLDYLKKRLIGSKSAAAAAETDSDDFVFPDWTGVDQVTAERIDWRLVARIHIGILEALNLWVKEFFIDFHNDQGLTEHLLHFLRVAAKEISVWDNVGEGEEILSECAEQIKALWDDLRSKFSQQLFTPLVYRSNEGLKGRKRLTIPSNGGLRELDSFVDKLDYSARVAFKSIRLVDWMTTFEIFESQSTDSLGFFLPKVSLIQENEGDTIMQDIFFLLPRLRRTTDPNNTLLNSLPRPIREIFQLHQDMRDWVCYQVTDPTIDADSRSRRIVAFLKALAICRKRMGNFDMHDRTDHSKRSAGIPSFVESAIAAGLMKPDSRLFSHAWTNAAKDTVGPVANLDTLEQIIPVIATDDNSRMRPLMPCAGWLVERMLEIVCYVPNMLVESNRLINFDKRRYVYNLVNNVTAMGSAANTPSNGPPRTDDLPVNFSLPYEIERRAIKDAVNRENQYSKSGKIRVFWKLFFQEQDKLRRDKAQREVIERLLRDNARANYRKQPPPPAIEPPAKVKSGKRLGVNTFIKAVRPISMALTNTRTLPYHPGRTVSPYDLPPAKGMEHGRKPAHQIDLKTIQSIACGKNSKDRLMWKIRSESGTAYLFQAPSDAELAEWLRLVSSIRGIQVSDGSAESISALTMISKGPPPPVFGVSLAELCRREGSKVPIVVEMLLSEIEARGLAETGIYRVGGALASMNALKHAFDSGEDVRMDDDRWFDINAVAGTLKLFMRELPEPVFTEEVLAQLKDATGPAPSPSEPETPADSERRQIRYREIMLQQPPHLYHFLRRLFLHLALIEQHSDQNKMTAINLAIVFCMNLAPQYIGSSDFGIIQNLVRQLILGAAEIFPPVDEEFPVDLLMGGGGGVEGSGGSSPVPGPSGSGSGTGSGTGTGRGSEEGSFEGHGIAR